MNTKRMKELRKAKGLSQKDLAEIVEVSQAAITYFEQGMKVPSVPVLHRIAETLGCTMDELVK